jgi:peptidoglycan lytic transglycosylase
MHFTPRKPLRSFKNVVFAVIAIFVVSNFIDSPFTRVLAPVAASTVSAVALEDYIPSDVPTSGDHDLDLVIARTGRDLGVDPRLIHAVIWQESKYKPSAESHAGAQGLMQLMPAAAQRFGCEDRNDAAANVTAGTKYLRWLLKRFDGNVTLALAAYNAGEGNVDRWISDAKAHARALTVTAIPYSETRAYVQRVLMVRGQYRRSYSAQLGT